MRVKENQKKERGKLELSLDRYSLSIDTLFISTGRVNNIARERRAIIHRSRSIHDIPTSSPLYADRWVCARHSLKSPKRPGD